MHNDLDGALVGYRGNPNFGYRFIAHCYVPLTGALDIEATTAALGHKYVFLYLGGFILAVAIEKWDLHRRIALNIINLIGSKIKFIFLGFMIATAFLSMWISNTATSVMMLPIGTAIISQLKNNPSSNENEALVLGRH